MPFTIADNAFDLCGNCINVERVAYLPVHYLWYVWHGISMMLLCHNKSFVAFINGNYFIPLTRQCILSVAHSNPDG